MGPDSGTSVLIRSEEDTGRKGETRGEGDVKRMQRLERRVY